MLAVSLADNWEPAGGACLHNTAFRSAVIAARDFEFVNEGTAERPKWGYVGNTTGAELQLRISTKISKTDTRPPTVYIAHLKSYQDMGRALVR